MPGYTNKRQRTYDYNMVVFTNACEHIHVNETKCSAHSWYDISSGINFKRGAQ